MSNKVEATGFLDKVITEQVEAYTVREGQTMYEGSNIVHVKRNIVYFLEAAGLSTEHANDTVNSDFVHGGIVEAFEKKESSYIEDGAGVDLGITVSGDASRTYADKSYDSMDLMQDEPESNIAKRGFFERLFGTSGK